MKRLISSLFLMLFLVLAGSAQAVKIEFHEFANKEQEKLYLQLIAELRCVKCQNQNLAESNAELAKDMREKAYEIIINGGTREDVIKYMTDRYGNFVLYKPPFIAKTLLLWIGPAVFLFLSLYMLIKLIKKQQKEPVETLSEADREVIHALLKANNKPKKSS